MRKLIFPTLVLGVFSVAVCQAATINVPADQSTIQAAINAAADGDTIVIADGTYPEDLIIPGSSFNSRNDLTIEAAPGATVIIEAQNTRTATPANAGLLGVLATALGAPGTPTYHGLIVEGKGITLRNLTVRNYSTIGDPLFGEGAVLAVFGDADNLTIENCVFEANPTSNSPIRPIYLLPGRYDQIPGGLGGAIAGAGYGTTDYDNLTVTNSSFRYGSDVFDTVDAALYLTIFLSGGAATIPPVHPTGGSFTDCEFVGRVGGGNLGEVANGNELVFTNCHFYNGNDGYDLGGGVQRFVNCLFESSNNGNLVDIDADLSEGGFILPEAEFINTVFCGGTNGDHLFRVRDGNATFSGCIFNVTNTNSVTAILYSVGNVASDWFTVGGAWPPATQVLVDQCDFINPNGMGIRGHDAPDVPGEPGGTLNVTNSIFTCLDPISLQDAAGVAPMNANINNNNLFGTGSVSHPNDGWVLSSANNLNEFTAYTNSAVCPDPADAADYYTYSNQSLATAGTSGQPIGSQGGSGAGATSSIENWNLY